MPAQPPAKSTQTDSPIGPVSASRCACRSSDPVHQRRRTLSEFAGKSHQIRKGQSLLRRRAAQIGWMKGCQGWAWPAITIVDIMPAPPQFQDTTGRWQDSLRRDATKKKKPAASTEPRLQPLASSACCRTPPLQMQSGQRGCSGQAQEQDWLPAPAQQTMPVLSPRASSPMAPRRAACMHRRHRYRSPIDPIRGGSISSAEKTADKEAYVAPRNNFCYS